MELAWDVRLMQIGDFRSSTEFGAHRLTAVYKFAMLGCENAYAHCAVMISAGRYRQISKTVNEHILFGG
jgi:5-carboxymethyl-2-hydroxymuconate isomerase